MLPFAAAAQSEMGAKRLCPIIGKFGKGSGFGDIHALSFFERDGIDHVAGYCAFDLDDAAVFTAADGEAFFCGVDDVYVVELFAFFSLGLVSWGKGN